MGCYILTFYIMTYIIIDVFLNSGN